LILTACVGDVQAINLLVSSGADLERTSQTGFSPLLCASEKGHLDAVIALVDAGSYLLHRNNVGSLLFFLTFIRKARQLLISLKLMDMAK
jgi:ankyrin repeat protein